LRFLNRPLIADGWSLMVGTICHLPSAISHQQEAHRLQLV
jgi:hypothetical protein